MSAPGSFTDTNATPSRRVSVRDFDVHDWRGLTELLKAGKELLNDPLAYAEFRNLVLAYAQTKGDQAIQKNIDAILLRASDFATTASENVPVSVTSQRPLVRRPRPRFDSSQYVPVRVESVSLQAAQDSIPRSLPLVSVEDHNESLAPINVQNISQDSAPTPDIEQSIPPTPTNITPEPSSVPIEGEPKPTLVIPQNPGTAFISVETYKERIAVIKRIVHETLGNPAAIMDMPNGIGKEYMGALLGALKATGAGSTVGVDTAMMRLEQAFTTLLAASKNPTPPLDPPVSTMETSAPVSQQEQVTSIPETRIERDANPQRSTHPFEIHQDIAPSIPSRAHDVREEVEDLPYDVVTDDAPEISEVNRETVSTVSYNDHISKEATNTPETEDAIPGEELVSTTDGEVGTTSPSDEEVSNIDGTSGTVSVQPPDGVATETEDQKEKTSEIDTVGAIPEKRVKVSQEASRYTHGVHRRDTAYVHKKIQQSKLSNPTPFPEALRLEKNEDSKRAPAAVVVKQSELMAPRITKALHELLNEWKIFNGSGVFGFGPGGHEHPLYKTLAPLSMGIVLSGRWEGSSPKTIRVLKEYIDAWRHEQSVQYVVNETFEHYLRRVVERILRRRDFD